MRTVVSEAKGRHVVAACAIQAGTTLFIEKPFAAAPVSSDRCELCLQTCLEPIVCEDCKVPHNLLPHCTAPSCSCQSLGSSPVYEKAETFTLSPLTPRLPLPAHHQRAALSEYRLAHADFALLPQLVHWCSQQCADANKALHALECAAQPSLAGIANK